jgi:ATP-dependent helicase/nuclease subunit B
MTSPHPPPALSLSALERYQDCPFKFFASDLLRLEEPPEDELSLTPRERGRFIHEVFQRFFE